MAEFDFWLTTNDVSRLEIDGKELIKNSYLVSSCLLNSQPAPPAGNMCTSGGEQKPARLVVMLTSRLCLSERTRWTPLRSNPRYPKGYHVPLLWAGGTQSGKELCAGMCTCSFVA